MGDKCDSHDKCFDRVYRNVENLGRKMDEGLAKISDQLAKGAILHERLLFMIEQREKDHVDFKTRTEAEIRSLKTADGIDWKSQGVMLARGLIEKGLLIAAAMIWYAARNGWGR